MEEEKNDKEKKNMLLKQNTLEKLIKLDQKNSSLSPFKHKNRRRLLIRDQALNSDFSWTPNQLEQGLYIFWNHIDQYYFKNVKEDDMEQIDLLIESLEIVAKDLSVKYAGFEAYEAFKKIVSQKFKKMLLTEALAKTNLQNLKKKYYLSSKKLLQKAAKGAKGGADQQNFSYDVSALKAAKKKDRVNGFLLEEAKQLDSFLQKTEEKSTKPSALDAEIEKLTKEYKRMNEANSDKLVRLKNKAAKQKNAVDINEIINPPSAHEGARSSLSTKRGASSNNKITDLKNVMVDYLKRLIVRLENQQAAESIKYVIDCKKPEKSGGQYQFCVIFDEALSHNECWVNESNLDQLDKLREQSLFKSYKIPQKLYHSVNSANLMAFHACDQQVMSHVATLKEKPWKDLMKKGFIDGAKGFNKEELFMKSKEFGLCHHCKYLFPGEFLLKCTYRTSELKPPTISSEYLNPVATHGRIPKRSMWNNRLSVSSFYQKKNGELICSRSFCRLCLKQNFDMKSSDVVHKPNWICPFCDGVCNCSRCLRHDHINKLMSLYSILGGKLDLIKQESYLERYIQNSIPFDPKQNPSRKLSYYALKPTRGNKTEKQVSDVKGKVSVFKDNLEQYQSLKELRVSLERMRILCSQVSKRENIKTKLEALNSKITNKNLDAGKKVVITPGPKARRAPIVDIEPPVIKKRKRGRPPKSAPKLPQESEPESEFEEEESDDEEEEEESFSEEEEESLLKKKLNRKNKAMVRNNKAKASKYIKATKGKQNQGEAPRKRGRPRKYPLPEEEYEVVEEEPEYDEDEEEQQSEEDFEEEEYDEEDGSEENESESEPSSDDEEDQEEEDDYEEEEEENSEDEESESAEEDERWKDRKRKAKLIQDKIQEMRKLNNGKPRRGRPPKISNPNEPRDFEEQDEKPKKPYRLKKELQKILIHQNVNQFEVFARTPNSKRATRSSSSKPKNKKIR